MSLDQRWRRARIKAIPPLGLVLCLSLPLNAQESIHAVVVELFTSEGCSSCPAADDLLRTVDRQATASGQHIIALGEHVTYWNGLGWKDSYSLPAFTARQEAYAARFGLSSVYTPQMVINGREQIIGSDAAALHQALNTESKTDLSHLSISATSMEASGLAFTFALDMKNSQAPVELLAILTDDHDQSHVLRGENSGRTLQHTAVARVLVRVAEISGSTQQTIRLPLPAEMRFAEGSGHTLVLIAQMPHTGKILAAAQRRL